MANSLNLMARIMVRVQGMNQLGQLNNRMTSLQRTTDRTRNRMGQFATESSKLTTSVHKMNFGLSDSIKMFGTLATAIGGAAAVAKLLDATVGAAARKEFSQSAMSAIFPTKEITKEATDFLESKQLKSMFTLEDFYAAGQGMASTFKDNIDGFKEAVGQVERLATLDPEQGIQGAAYAMREAMSDDSMDAFRSLQERFELNKAVIRQAREEADALGLTGKQKNLFVVNKALEDRGATQEFINRQMATSVGLWTQIKNKSKTALMKMGDYTLKYLKPALGEVNKWFTPERMDKIAKTWGKRLAYIINGFIDLGKDVNDWLTGSSFKEFINDMRKTLTPFVGRLKDWRDLMKEIWKFISTHFIPVLKDFNKQLGDTDTAVGKVWQVLAPFLATLLVLKGFKGLGKKLGLDVMFKRMVGPMAFIFGGAMLARMKKWGGLLRYAFAEGKVAKFLRVFSKAGLRSVSKLFAGTGWGLIISILIEVGFWLADNKEKVEAWAKAFNEKLGPVKDRLKEIFQKMGEDVSPIWNDFTKYITDTWDRMMDHLSNPEKQKSWSDMWSNVTTVAKGALDMMVLNVTNAISGVFSILGFLGDSLWDTFVDLLPILAVTIENAFKTITDVISGIFDAWGALFNGDWSGFFSGLWSIVTGFVDNMIGGFARFFSTVFDSLGKWGNDMYENLGGLFNDLITNALDFSTGMLDVFGKTWAGLTSKITAPFQSAYEKVTGFLSGMLSKAQDVLEKIGLVNASKPSLDDASTKVKSKTDGSHRFGRASIPFDGYQATLHKGERVLTAQENKDYSDWKYSGSYGGGVNIGSLAGTIIIREDADIDKFAAAFAREVNRAANNGA
jgi:hypothetical protein